MTKQMDTPASKTEYMSPCDREKCVEVLSSLVPDLLSWYRAHRRDLPWRTDPTPYHVWVSEIMLQQTRVEAVKPYYERFLAALPSVSDLAGVSDDLLMKLWQGLGYYSRARQLKKAAGRMMRDYGGTLPRTKKELLSLPGIGPYTAGAVLSFAYGIPSPAVDGNVLRVLARLFGDERNVLLPEVRRDDEDILSSVIPADAASDFGQALIELGALVCLPTRPPLCDSCPLAARCRAYREGLCDRLPVREKKKERRVEEHTVLLIRDGAHTLLCRRPAHGLLASLWEFPHMEGCHSAEDAVALARALGYEPLRVVPLPEAKHLFTHIEWRMTGYELFVADGAGETPVKECSALPDRTEFVFADIDDLRDLYAVPSAFSAYLGHLMH